jgi:plasmid stability protein
VRTTLTLDDDVAAQLRRLQARSGGSWKDVVNEVMRAGLVARERRGTPARRRSTRSVRLGRPIIGDISNVHETLSLAEGDARG